MVLITEIPTNSPMIRMLSKKVCVSVNQWLKHHNN